MIRSFYHNSRVENGNLATLASENKVVPLFRAIGINRTTYLYYDFDPRSVTEHDYVTNTINRIRTCFYGRYQKPMRVTLPKDVKVIIGEGFVMRESDGAFLLLLGIRKKSIKNTSWEAEDYVLYYSIELMTDTLLSTLNKRLQKEFLTSAVNDGIEVIITDSKTIRKNAFAKVMSIRFNSVDIMQYYFKEVLPKAFFSSGSNTDLVEAFDPGFSLMPIEVPTAEIVQEVEAVEFYEDDASHSTTLYYEEDFPDAEPATQSFRMDILDLSQVSPQEEAEILADLTEIEEGRAGEYDGIIVPTTVILSVQEANEIMNDLAQIGAGPASFEVVLDTDWRAGLEPTMLPQRTSGIELIDDTE
jgi:hypothetical protein